MTKYSSNNNNNNNKIHVQGIHTSDKTKSVNDNPNR